MAIEWNKLIAISSVRVFILKLMELHLKVVLVRICGVLFGFHVFLVVSLKSLVILNIYREREFELRFSVCVSKHGILAAQNSNTHYYMVIPKKKTPMVLSSSKDQISINNTMTINNFTR
ncbi:putative WRKY transcription factor 4 isoform X1 [Iris pallida]|uniref:WRKY transcription factor 4 isoform X1 n=1 Tax=Iris pallida TaxID=29817 RepID=A0AAX6E8I7_IRIPA|nr:putative WRKY transcription factor 4 isoform X1 [Iris pallida]